ncbi:MAG: J domain-containing protein [Phycisphaerae bacterium]|jgi:hypothetical protein|nr:J domain-containing protein [Phycisphaerae bacterium]
MEANKDPYKTLGIEPNATVEEIKRAYREAAIRWHPDISNSDTDESERQFKLMTDAYRYALREVLLAASDGRRARQAQTDFVKPIRGGPHPDSPRFTPPTPSPRPNGCKLRSRYSSRMRRKDTASSLSIVITILLIVFMLGIVFLVVSEPKLETDRVYERSKEEIQAADNLQSFIITWVSVSGLILLTLLLVRVRMKF